jgi:hypothetical protein
MRKMSKLDENKTIEEINNEKKDTITHLSTWLMVKKDHEILTHIDGFVGESILPVKLNLKDFGEDAHIFTFSNLLVEELLIKLHEITGINLRKMSVKALEDAIIRRIDNKTRDAESGFPNTI